MELGDSLNSVLQELCASCKKLDISTFQFENQQIPETGKPVLSLGKPPQNISLLKCPLCQLFFSVSTEYKRKYQLHVRLFDQIHRPPSVLPKSTPNQIPRSPFFSILRENSRLTYNYEIADEIGQRGVIVYQPAMVSAPSTVQTVNATAVDYGLLKSWLTDCGDSHEGCAEIENRQSSLSYLYLIDCDNLRVVRAKTEEQYLALSYVWGEPNPQTKYKPIGTADNVEGTFLLEQTPLTIQDAICVVQNLGRRYLWVDRYCIKQKSCPEKDMMIRNMDQIYENSEATIVALHGKNDEAGLPGVSRISRTLQPRLSIGNGYLTSSFPPISAVLANSKWITRGWTYQEARCSRRCLFFTQYQVYFVCRATTRSETVPSSPESCWVASILNSRSLDANLFAKREDGISKGLFMDRLMFSQRDLTRQEDVLDAFRGILSRSLFTTTWGIPVIPVGSKMDPCVGLALGLLWVKRPSWSVSAHVPSTKVVPYTRRPGFPTWSWTSIMGEIYNEGCGAESIFEAYLGASKDISATNEADLQFWLQFEGKSMPLKEVIQLNTSNVLTEHSPYLWVEGDLVRVRAYGKRGVYRFCGQDGEYSTPVVFAQYDLPVPLEYSMSRTAISDETSTEEALVLVEWNDSQKQGKKRIVMMLLDWVTEDRAERRGLLSDYRSEWDAEFLKRIPRTRKKFILQ